MTVNKDLPVTSMDVCSTITSYPQIKLKRRLPMCHTHINYFVHQVRSIGKEMFTVDELADKFQTQAWKNENLRSKDSEMRQILLSLPGSQGEHLCLHDILCLGLLWCQGDYYNKAEQLFEFVTPFGQKEYKAYSKYGECVDESPDQELIDYSEMWELILLTLFEIASHTIIEHCHRDNRITLLQLRIDPVMRARSARLLQSTRTSSMVNKCLFDVDDTQGMDQDVVTPRS